MGQMNVDTLRPCGRLETYSTARHHLGFYNNVGLTATYTSSSTQQPSLESLIFAALHHVVANHPNLSAIPINEDKSHPGVHFASLPEIDLRTCVEFRRRGTALPQGDETDGELDGLLRELHDRNFKEGVKSRPYWRLIIASYPRTPCAFTASWIFHHALSDGASSMLFHQSFLEGLNAVPAPKDIDPVVRTPTTRLPPSLEELHPMTISWSFFLRAVAGSLLPSYFAPRSPDLWTGYPVDAIVQTHVPSHNTTIALSAETTKTFAEKCRKEGTSVTAALSTLLAAAIFPHIWPDTELRIDTPMSLRPVLDVSDTQMINAITNHTFTHHRTTESRSSNVIEMFSWATARRVKHDLVEQVKKKGADSPIALLKYVSNMHEYLVDKLGKPRDSSAEVSNLGVWRTPDPTDPDVRTPTWKLGRMTFSQSLNRTGPPLSLSAVTGGDACLVLSFNWEGEGGESALRRVPGLVKAGLEALVADKKEEST